MGIARDLSAISIPEGLVVDLKVLEKLADDKVRAGLHGFAGRADGRPVPHGQPGSHDPHRARATPSCSRAH
jgi:hypothetical protein